MIVFTVQQWSNLKKFKNIKNSVWSFIIEFPHNPIHHIDLDSMIKHLQTKHSFALQNKAWGINIDTDLTTLVNKKTLK